MTYLLVISFWMAIIASMFLFYWAVPRRWFIVAAFILSLLLPTFVLYALGNPRPFSVDILSEEVIIYSVYIEPDEKIHVWGLNDGTLRYYVLPWNTKVAEKMQKHMRGDGVMKNLTKLKHNWFSRKPYEYMEGELEPLPPKESY